MTRSYDETGMSNTQQGIPNYEKTTPTENIEQKNAEENRPLATYYAPSELRRSREAPACSLDERAGRQRPQREAILRRGKRRCEKGALRAWGSRRGARQLNEPDHANRRLADADSLYCQPAALRPPPCFPMHPSSTFAFSASLREANSQLLSIPFCTRCDDLGAVRGTHYLVDSMK